MASNKTLDAKKSRRLGAGRSTALLIETRRCDRQTPPRGQPADTPSALIPAFVEDGAILGGVRIVNPFKG